MRVCSFYGQISPRKTPPPKGHGGFIEWAHTAMFLDHVTLFRYAAHEQKSAAWTAADEVALAAWWKEFQGYVESKPAQGERRMENNHGSWYDADWLSISLFNGDSASAKAAAKEAQHRRIALQISPNGSEWIELERNVPSGYCQYNLMALSTVADLAASAGAVDVWGFETDAGASLRQSIDWLLPFATNESAWPWKQPETPSWKSMEVVLRRASRHFKNRTYEEGACKVYQGAGEARYYARSVLNLQLPPQFDVKCE